MPRKPSAETGLKTVERERNDWRDSTQHYKSRCAELERQLSDLKLELHRAERRIDALLKLDEAARR